MKIFKAVIRWLLIKLYNVDVRGLEHIGKLEGPSIIVANHASYLDVVLLFAFLAAGADVRGQYPYRQVLDAARRVIVFRHLPHGSYQSIIHAQPDQTG